MNYHGSFVAWVLFTCPAIEGEKRRGIVRDTMVWPTGKMKLLNLELSMWRCSIELKKEDTNSNILWKITKKLLLYFCYNYFIEDVFYLEKI